MQETSWFDAKGTGELINRLSNDTYFVGSSLSQNVSDGLRSLAMISVGTGMMVSHYYQSNPASSDPLNCSILSLDIHITQTGTSQCAGGARPGQHCHILWALCA